MNDTDVESIIRGTGSRRRWLLLSAVAGLVIAAAVIAFFLTRPAEMDVVVEPERVEAAMGRLSTEVELSGSALAERSASLSFEVPGVVASVAVGMGDEVREGDALATLDDSEAQRRVETAEIQLRQAELRLDNLLAEPDDSAVASAEQAIASSKSQVLSAELALERLEDPPAAADIASAEQAVASALAQISSAEQALADLDEPPSAADIASAEQAVASALGQISSAEQALADLDEPASASDIASAEQAVANALAQLSGAEQTVADLTEEPSEAEVAESRAAVTQAEVQLASAERHTEESTEALTEAFDAFCERYSGLTSSDEVIGHTCGATLPLSDTETDDLRESFEDRSSTYESLGTALIDANVAFVGSSADRDSAQSALGSAEERLAELLTPVSEEDVVQAEHSVEAARASHIAAVARLDELQEAPGEDDVYQAQQSLDAAKASHAAAVARLDDLQAEVDEDDVYQAQQSLDAAKASHAAAVARLDDLEAEVDEDDREQARATLETARASLASAQAQLADLLAGPSENEIEQQRQDVLLAELSLEEAREALTALIVLAPFDGVIEEVSVHPGDYVAAALSAFTLSTSNRMLISLTVTEEDLPELEAGQTGVASFDAIQEVNYPVRVESISRVPNAEQGVVTYDVEARILAGEDARQGAGAAPGGGFGRGGAGGGFGGGGAGGGFGGSFPGFELPEGVTAQDVQQALSTGEPLPEGVVLPPGVEDRLRSFLGGGGAGPGRGGAGQGGGTGQGGGEGQQGADAVARRPLPAPGMSASVVILTEVREESVLLPTSAVRSLDGRWFVTIPSAAGEGEGVAHERIFVDVGESDGNSVEITSGLEAGAVVLVGADNEGIAFTATLQQPQANPGFGQGPGGFGPPGGGGRR